MDRVAHLSDVFWLAGLVLFNANGFWWMRCLMGIILMAIGWRLASM